MFIPFFMILLLFAFIFFIAGKQRKGLLLLSFTLLIFYAAGTGHFPQLLLDRLQTQLPLTEMSWGKNNVIVVLGSGTTKWNNNLVSSSNTTLSRLYEALKNYSICKKLNLICKIIPSGGDPGNHGQTEAETMARELIEVGVSSDDIIIESKSNNTQENAEFSSRIIKQQAFDQVILVTSGTHLYRAELWFMNYGIYSIPAPADHLLAFNTFLPHSKNIDYLEICLHEYGGIIQYYLKKVLPW